ncbi:MAG: ATP-binding protein [Clostridia bacterium]|jgi:MinD superfamily P-loop ATPase
MKEIVVISGKGGTGKTSITASFAALAADKLIAADCDVDAADMHLLLKPDMAKAEDFYSGETARIDPSGCTACGRCLEVCRFGAVKVIDQIYSIDPLSCEGCGYCARVCPTKTITNHPEKAGVWYLSRTRLGFTMVHAKLGIGAENSGKLVAHVKKQAKAAALAQDKQYVLVDGSPGIGCPVVSSLSGANYVVLVTEPTVSGVHDLKRVYELVKKFNIPAGCIINKADLNPGMTESIRRFLETEHIDPLAELPYDEGVTKAMVAGLTIVEYDTGIFKEQLQAAWARVCLKVDTI